MPRRISHKQLDWSLVKQYYNEHTTSGYIMAALESRKRLEHSLRRRHVAGNTLKQKITIAAPYFTEPDDIKAAEASLQLLIHEPDASIDGTEASHLITTFRKAVEELEAGPSTKLTTTDRIRIQLLTRYTNTTKHAKQAALILPAILIMITLLAGTESGKLTASLAIQAAEFIVSWVFVIAAILIALAFIIFGSLAYFEKRK